MHHMIAEDDPVASHASAQATHEGEFPDLNLELTGEEIEILGTQFDRVEDSKLAETRFRPDALGSCNNRVSLRLARSQSDRLKRVTSTSARDK